MRTGFISATGSAPAACGLRRLRPADLGTARRHRRVQRHVLGLERRHPYAPPSERAADPGRDDALAGIGGAPGNEQGAVHGRPRGAIEATPAQRSAAAAPVATESTTARSTSAGPRGSAVPQPRPRLDPAVVAVGAAQAHAESAGEGGLEHARVRARMGGAVATQCPARRWRGCRRRAARARPRAARRGVRRAR